MINSLFPIESLRLAVQLALFNACALAMVIFFLRRKTQEAYLDWWMLGWAAYAVNLAVTLAFQIPDGGTNPVVTNMALLGLAGLFLTWGTLHLAGRPRYWLVICVGSMMMFLASCVVAFYLPDRLLIKASTTFLPAGGGLYSAYAYARHRKFDRKGSVVAIAFGLWGLLMLATPLLELATGARVVGYLASAVLMLVIAVALPVIRVIEREVTQIKNVVAATEQKFRSVFESAPDALFLVDLASTKITDANLAARCLTMYKSEELVDRPFASVCPEVSELGDSVSDHWRMFSAIFKPFNPFTITRANGAEVQCEGSIRRVEGYLQEVIEVTVREMQARAKLGEQFRRREKLSALGQLLAGVAHEINNPLAVITGYTQVLVQRSDLDQKTKGDLGKIKREAERVGKIIRNVLSFARPCEPQANPVDPNQLVKEALEIAENAAQAAHIEVVKRLAPHLPPIMADGEQIEQVLLNLFSNAIDAMARQERERRLTVTTEENGFRIRILVEDTGAGIPREIHAKIFDPFFTTKPPGKGTGLGLSVSNTIMQSHHGSLSVQSEVGKGSQFIMELPIVASGAARPTADASPEKSGPPVGGASTVATVQEPATVTPRAIPATTTAYASPIPEAAALAASPAAPEDQQSAVAPNNLGERSYPPQPLGHTGCVLIVDDEPGIAGVLQEVLTADGYTVDTAINGADAGRRLASKTYDVIISDLCMPELDGPGLYKAVAEHHPQLCDRIIFMTGDTVNPHARTFLESTSNMWFNKPFNICEIESAVNKVVTRAGQAKAPEPAPSVSA